MDSEDFRTKNYLPPPPFRTPAPTHPKKTERDRERETETETETETDRQTDRQAGRQADRLTV